jgi:hypothetical protein
LICDSGPFRHAEPDVSVPVSFAAKLRLAVDPTELKFRRASILFGLDTLPVRTTQLGSRSAAGRATA